MHALRDTRPRRRRAFKLPALDHHHLIADLRQRQARQQATDTAANHDRYIGHPPNLATPEVDVLSGTTQVVWRGLPLRSLNCRS